MPTRSIIITGGASGIGHGISTYFASTETADTHLTILDINPTSGAEAVTTLRAAYPSASVSFEQCDVSSWESQAAAFERVYARQGRIDVVFANAGITEKGSLLPTPEEEKGGAPMKPELSTLEVNLFGVVFSKTSFLHILVGGS